VTNATIHKQCYDLSMEQITMSLVNLRVSIVLADGRDDGEHEHHHGKGHHSTQVHHRDHHCTETTNEQQHCDLSRDQIKTLEK
jgi:hypothetical protein